MNIKQFILFTFFVVCTFVCCTYAQTTKEPELAAGDGKPKKHSKEDCVKLNGSCEECVKNPHCLWCPSRDDVCSPYPSGKILPGNDYCPLDVARWGVCWVNYKILLICMGIIALAITLSITCCCVYCCCCRGKDSRLKRKLEEDEKKYERQSKERKEKHSERRKERESKYDEIRKKYGLKKEDNPYQRFEEEA